MTIKCNGDMIWVDVNVNKMGYSKNNEDSLKMDFILREMNEVDYGLKKMRRNRNIEADSAARVYQRRIRCNKNSGHCVICMGWSSRCMMWNQSHKRDIVKILFCNQYVPLCTLI